MIGGKEQFQKSFWLARSRRNLDQRQVAYLLGHKNGDHVSRYENGSRLPTLRTALKLEIILGVSVRALFPEVNAALQNEIKTRASADRMLNEKLSDAFVEEQCTYEGLLTGPNVSMAVREKIHRHAAFLINTMNLMDEEPKREGGASE